MTGAVVALTGATGFIGRFLLRDLQARGYRVRVLLRRPVELPGPVTAAVVGDLRAPRNLAAALADVDYVVHSAGIAHAMSGRPCDDHRSMNTEVTVALARAARRAGARRFVFLSSIRAQTGPVADGILSETDEPRPTEPYGRSKLAAEQGLAEVDIDWVALRPVVIYGPGVIGNMAALVRLACSPAPLPFGALSARRSVLALDNLAAAVETVLAWPDPLRRPLIVSDPDPLTIPEIVAALRRGLGRHPGLLPVPLWMLDGAARLLRHREAVLRLSGSLVASPVALMGLGWSPRVDTLPALAALARSCAGPG